MNEHWEETSGWTRTRYAMSNVQRPISVEEVCQVLLYAESHNQTIAPRGAGHSYTDAMLNDKGITLDLSQMRHILAWDSQKGVIQVEPGVTIDDLWRTSVVDGWWPAAHPSVLGATVGGSISMNAHGTNAWKRGTIGDYVLAFELLLASGKRVSVTRANNPDLFDGVIGGMGLLGILISVTLQLQPIASGIVMVRQRPARNLSEMFEVFAEEATEADYLEGWIDGHATGRYLGRGLVRRGDLLQQPHPQSLRLERQRLASNVAGIIPPSLLGRTLQPLFNDVSVGLGSSFLYAFGSLSRKRRFTPVSIAQFHFHNNTMYRALETMFPLGGYGFQPCVPAEQAPFVFRELFERSQKVGILPFWCWFKQHRADSFLLGYQVDGFSLDLAYRVTRQNAVLLPNLLTEMRDVVIRAGGQLYLAKDSVLDKPSYTQSIGINQIERFLSIKAIYDPSRVFQSDLFRRVFIV